MDGNADGLVQGEGGHILFVNLNPYPQILVVYHGKQGLVPLGRSGPLKG